MKIEKLNPSEETPFGIDLIEWPNCNGLLYYLEKSIGIKVIAKSSWFLSGDYFATFEYKSFLFDIETPISTPFLYARKGCPEEIFCEVFNCVTTYKPRLCFSIRGFFKFLKLQKFKV